VFADVVVNVPRLTSSFSYSIPEPLIGRVRLGHLVTVPFGSQRTQGIVTGLTDTPPALKQVSPIEGLIDPEPVLTPAQIDLARWMAHTYLASPIECLVLMLPPGLSKRADALFSLNPGEPAHGAWAVAPGQQALYELLQARGALRGRQIDRALPRSRWRSAADGLEKRGLLSRQSMLEPPTVHAKHVHTARLSASLAQVEAARPRLSRSPAKAARLSAVLDFLSDDFDPVDVSWVYAQTGSSLQDLKDLAEMGLLDLGEAEVWRDSLAGKEFVPFDPPELTPDQQQAWDALAAIIAHSQTLSEDQIPAVSNNQTPGVSETPRVSAGSEDQTPTAFPITNYPLPITPVLLHGVTGSGKTEIYLRALAATLAQGRRALVLVPEIALTAQTVRRFAARFPGRVAVWHSELGDGERYDTWRRARLGLVDVVIGARSALFAPLPNIGLIVLDEEHDDAYKQDALTGGVAYHAREAAVEYARRLGAVCVLGSATPDMVSFHRARQGRYQLLELPQRIMGHARRLKEQAERFHVESHYHPLADAAPEAQMIDLPPVEVVDLRQELRAGNTSIFSRRLQTALAEVVGRGEQAILFLNRRGTATFVFCRDCGEALKCGNCDMPLTYHLGGDAERGSQPAAPQLVCHHCNFRREQPQRCPNCGSKRIKYFGSGTERVEAAVLELLPGVRTLRWDRDVTRFRGAHELILQQFSSHQADVLVGTQMIAKGLDLPLVTLVGVISADVGLALPDYRASERTFQVLTQVAGRAGRGLLGGRVVLQTYNPEHYAIKAASTHNYHEFFARELRYRKELGYPPFRRVLRMVYRHADNDRAETEARGVLGQLQERIKAGHLAGTDLVGPAPCFFGKINGEYRWQIIVRSPDPAALLRGLTFKGWQVDVDPVSTL
jgi:primosomal protein N' (replication factor Y) (superfamily II helicase)